MFLALERTEAGKEQDAILGAERHLRALGVAGGGGATQAKEAAKLSETHLWDL